MRSERPSDSGRTLDAREIDGEPFGAIMDALDEVADGESLLLIHRFEPTPLYDVLEKREFEYETTNPAPDEWHVEITPV